MGTQVTLKNKRVCAENLKTIVIVFIAQVINSRKNSCPLLESDVYKTKKPSEKKGFGSEWALYIELSKKS